MARIVNFSLEMKDGYRVEKDIEELRAHFDFERAAAYVRDGKLVRWLRINGCKAEAEQITALDVDDALWENLSRILGVKMPEGDVDAATMQDRREGQRPVDAQMPLDPETMKVWADLIKLMEEQAEDGRVKSMLDVGYLWCMKTDSETARENAFRWFMRAKEAGSIEACKALVVCYTQGYGTERDAWQAVVCARCGAGAGDAEMMRCLAAFYRHGYGMEADLDKAEEWSRKAEEREAVARLEPPAADADEALKISYSKATTIVPEATTVAPEATAVVPDREISEMWEVRQWLKERDLEAILLSGRPLPKVDEAALAFIRKAARYGHAEGEYFLERYEGRTDNSVHMMELRQSSWQKMAERGNIYAVAGLAENRRKGYGGLQDENAILQGARLAANQGKSHGIARFAQCYEEGWGLNMNYEKASSGTVRQHAKGISGRWRRSRNAMRSAGVSRPTCGRRKSGAASWKNAGTRNCNL